MAQPDDGRGNLYEQVLEYAKREMDEAASKMEDIKQSLELLEARVEAAKAVYQAVASRLNLENEADGSGFGTSFPGVPLQVPEPPRTDVIQPPAPAAPQPPASAVPPAPEPLTEQLASPPAEVNTSNGSSEHAAPSEPENNLSDRDLIREHLAGKAQSPADEVPATEPPPVEAKIEETPTPPAAAEPTSVNDSFSMDLIPQHLEQKSKEQSGVAESQPAAPSPLVAPDSELTPGTPAPPEPTQKSEGADSGGLSDADRELIGAYLRSKQN
jgi:hypothetical protein